MAAGQKQGASLAQFATGGLIDDIDVTIQDALFTEYDYDGSIDHNILCLGIQYVDDNGKEYNQYYSAGELTYFVPSDDGSMAIPVADKQMLSDSCNAAKFLMSLLECGFPEEKLASGNVKELVGMKVHVKQHAQPKRQGLIRGGNDNGKEKTVLLVAAILSMPGEETAPAKAPAAKGRVAGASKPVAPGQKVPATPVPGKAAGKPALGGAKNQTASANKGGLGKPNGAAGPAVNAASDDDKAIAAEILSEILATNGGSVTKKELSRLAFQAAGERVQSGQLEAKDKNRITGLIFQDRFLHEQVEQGTVQYDGATVSLPE